MDTTVMRSRKGLQGIYCGYIGLLEKKMETTIQNIS